MPSSLPQANAQRPLLERSAIRFETLPLPATLPINEVKMSRTTLVIQHQPAKPDTFMVSRIAPDYKASDPVKLPSPYSFKVEGRPDSDLMQELRWYLEDFLSYPFPPETDHADRVLRALKAWGERAFEALFSNLSGGALFHAATAEDYSQLTIQIASDDP